MGIDITGIGTLAEAAKGIADKFWPDKTEVEKARLAFELQGMMNDYNLVKGQQDINLEEAKSTNWFVAGWRPFIGWVCGFAFGYVALFEPFARYIAEVGFSYTGEFPAIDTNITIQVLLGMLGLAGMRSWEKAKGAEGNR